MKHDSLPAVHDDNTSSITQWDEVAPWLRLSMVPGIGPLMQRDLLERFGSAQAVLDAAPAELRK